MIPLYTEEEYLLAKSHDCLKLHCHHCNKEFLCEKRNISVELKYNKGERKYCSTKCHMLHRDNSVIIKCCNCEKEFSRQHSQVSKNNFCSRSCAATYNNKHKTTGTRRSKLEVYIEEQLKSLYPNLEILFNDKSTINSELDIYIPSLNLAFELNGLFHYEAIFGQDKLDEIVNNDNHKFQTCIENKISLCVIDTSHQKYFKEQTSEKFLSVIIQLIDNQLVRHVW